MFSYLSNERGLYKKKGRETEKTKPSLMKDDCPGDSDR